MTDPVTEVSFGLGRAIVAVPAGWTTIELDGGVLTGDAPGVRPAVAGGVVEAVPGQLFANNVMIYAGWGGLDDPPEQLGPGQVWHDSRAEGTVRRLVIRVGEALGQPVTSVHLWGVVEGEPVMVVAAVDTRRLDDVWPEVELVLRSIFALDAPSWEEWF